MTHQVDSRSPDELGYGGTQLPPGVTQELAQRKEAAKTLRLILDDETRNLAQHAQQLMSRTQMLGVVADMANGPKPTKEQGEASYLASVNAMDVAMRRIAERIRQLFSEID